jgi:hypothetical protein
MVWRFIPRCYRRSARSRKRETIRLACDVWQRGAGYLEYPAETWELTKQMRRFALVAMCALALCVPRAVGADILDSETWDNHIEQFDEMSNANQFRRTMNRGFDAMSAIGGGSSGSGPSAANEMAAWKAALVLPPSSSQHELGLFLAQAKVPSEGARRALRTYMLQRFAAYPAEARHASPALDPRNVVDARVFALKTAYRAVRPDSPTSGAATLLLSVALSRQMTDAFTAHHYSRQQKQDARDYYVIVRALIQPAVQQVPGAGAFDPNARRSLTAFARAFLLKDTAAYAVQ